MLGDSTFRKELLEAADFFERRIKPPPAADSAPAPRANPTAPDTSQLRPLSGALPSPPHLRLPSLAYFYNEHMVPALPAVLDGVVDGWPAYSTRPWSDLAYLKRAAGHRTVPVEHGAHYLDDAFDERLMRLSDFIEQHLEAAPPGARPRAYLAQHALFEQCPRLRRDIVQPDYCLLTLDDGSGDDDGDGDDDDEQTDSATHTAEPPRVSATANVRVNAWLGPAGTLSPLHFDRSHNLLAQVVGSKYIRLYEPRHSACLYPHESGPHQVSSRIIDPDDADVASRFPRFCEAPYVDLVLRAGECLYIPPGWWHMVEAREMSFSVSFWW